MNTSARFITNAVAALLLGSLAAPLRADILYASFYNGQRIGKYTSEGVPRIFARVGANEFPVGLAFDMAGNLYVSNFGTNADDVEKITPAGVSSAFASGLRAPVGLAFDNAGNLYVADESANLIRKFTPDGIGSVFASSGLSFPTGIAFDSVGNLFVANSYGTFADTIVKFTPDGVGSVFANSGLSAPIGLAFDNAGNLYVTNNGNDTIEKFTMDGIGSVFASSGLKWPQGIAFDSAENLYVAHDLDTIVKFTPDGVGSIFANPVPGFNNPQFLAFTDDAGVPLKLPNQRAVVPEPSTGIIGIALCLPALLGLSRSRRQLGIKTVKVRDTVNRLTTPK